MLELSKEIQVSGIFCILQSKLQFKPREEGHRNACSHAGFPPLRPTTARTVATGLHRPPGLTLGTRGLDLTRHRPLPIGEGKGHPVPWAASRHLSQRGNKVQILLRQPCRGTMEHVNPMVMIWSRHRIHQPFGWWEAPGSSIQTTS